MLSCPLYARQRVRMYCKLKVRNPNLSMLFAKEENFPSILAFIKGSGKYNEL